MNVEFFSLFEENLRKILRVMLWEVLWKIINDENYRIIKQNI